MVFMGYLNKEESTRKSFTKDRFFKTGDIAIEKENKSLFITGRIKELIITAGGENIAPAPIEQKLKK